MFNTSIWGEKLIKEFTYKNVTFEVVSCPTTIWCGTLGYAPNCTDEPNIGALRQKYLELCNIPKVETVNAEWTGVISINYWQEGAVPRGMMFGQQVLTEKQDSNYDLYIMPESLFVRVANSEATARAAFDKDSCELYELFGLIKDSLEENGYVFGTNGAQEIEMYNHGAGLFYAYVPVMCK